MRVSEAQSPAGGGPSYQVAMIPYRSEVDGPVEADGASDDVGMVGQPVGAGAVPAPQGGVGVGGADRGGGPRAAGRSFATQLADLRKTID